MADAQRVIELVFQGVDRTGAATQAALDNLGRFSGNIESATQPIANFTAGALKIEGALLAAGASVVAFGVKVAGDFDASFRQLSTIIDAPAENLAAFRQAILDYASNSTQPLENIVGALSAAIGSGVEYSQSLELLTTAEKLSVATRSDLDDTTKVLVSTLSAYGMEISQARDVSDTFFKIIDLGDISMQDLSAGFSKIAPIAKASGVSLNEVGAAIATLTASGIAPSESIEYLRGAISNIISPSGQAKELAEKLGIQFNATGLQANGLAGLLQQVAEKTGGSAEMMKILFGDIGGFTAAVTLAGPQAGKFAESLREIESASGATDAAFAKITGSIENAATKINSALKVLLVNIGDPLLDEFGGVAEAIAAVFNAIGAKVKEDGLGGLMGVIEDLFGDVQAALERVARNLPQALDGADFSGFKEGIKAVAEAVKGLFGNIDITSASGLKTAIETLGAAFLGLSKYSAGVIESFGPLFNLLVQVGQGAAQTNTGFLQFAGTLSGLATQLNLASGLLNGLLAVLIAKEGAGLVGALRAAVPAADGLAKSLGQAGLVGAVGAASYAVGTAFNGVINDFVSSLSGSEQTLGTWIYELVNGAEEAEKFGFAVKGASENLDSFESGVSQIARGLDGVEGAVKKVTNGPFVDYLDAMGNIVLTTAASGESLDAWNKRLLESDGVIEKSGAGLDKFGERIKQSKLIVDKATGAVIGYQGSFEGLTEAEKEAAGGAAQMLDTTSKIIPVYDKVTGKITGYKQNLAYVETGSKGVAKESKNASNSISKLGEDSSKAANAVKSLNERFQEMQHAERLKAIESQTAITTAQINADAQTMTAAFESVATSLVSVNNLIGDLYGKSDGTDPFGFLKGQLLSEANNRANELNKAQVELLKAQMENLEARTEAMKRGDAMITIDGAGLAPHLEAFMFEVLKALQVKVNQDGYEMLLGTS